MKSMCCSGKKQLAPPLGEMKTMCHLFKMLASEDMLISHTLYTVDGENPVNNTINYLSTGGGFLPSTVGHM